MLGLIGEVYIEQAQAKISAASSLFISAKHVGENIVDTFAKISYGFRTVFNAMEINHMQGQAEKKRGEKELAEIEQMPAGQDKERRFAEFKANKDNAASNSKTRTNQILLRCSNKRSKRSMANLQ